MATGRVIGGGGGVKNIGWEQKTSPGGLVFWTRKDQPGWGYLDDRGKEGLQPGTTRYPIDFINYTWNDEPDIPKRTKRTKSGSEREITASGLTGRIPVVYGRARVGGSILAWRGLAGHLYETWGVAQGPISSFVDILMNGQDAYPPTSAYGSNVLFQTEVGLASPAGAVPSYFNTVTAAAGVERFPYLATCHALYNVATNSPVRDVPQPLFVINGRTLRDPRLGVDASGIPNQPEAYAKNPALALADYYTSQNYGLGVADTGIDWDSVGDVADYCDVLVAGLPRHTINWAIMRDGGSHRDVIDTIRQLGRIKVFKREGKRVFVAEKASSRVFTFTPNNSQAISADPGVPDTAPNIVKVSFLNPANYAEDTVSVSTAEAQTGEDPPIVEEFHLEGLDNASEALRQAVWLLAKRRNPLRVVFAGTNAEAAQIEVMDRVGYYSETATLGVDASDPQDLRIVKTQARADGTVIFTGELYDESYYSDATRVTETPEINTTPPPTDPPDPPTSPAAVSTLALGDGMTQDLPRSVLVEWIHPGWHYALHYKVTKQSSAAGSVETVVYDNLTAGPVLVELDLVNIWTVRVYAFIVATGVLSTALAGVVEPLVDFNFPVAEWPTDPKISIDSVTDKVLLTFGHSPTRTRDQYGASSLAHVGLGSVDLALMNNGNTFAVAGVATSGDTLTFDLGTAGQIDEISVSSSSFDTGSLGGNPPSPSDYKLIDRISHSDTGPSSGFTDLTVGNFGTWIQSLDEWGHDVTDFRVILSRALAGSWPAGNHRWWQFRFAMPGPFSLSLREFQTFRYSATRAPLIVHHELWDFSSGSGVLIATLPADRDYLSDPLDVTALVREGSFSDVYRVSLRLRSVDVTEAVSEYIDVYQEWVHGGDSLASPQLTVSAPQEVFSKELGDSTNTIGGVSIASGATLVKDTDTALAANSDSRVATQKAVKAYVDALAALGIEVAQDAIGAMSIDTATIDVTYTDATPELKWDVKDGSITLAKMANLAQDTAIGRVTASTGVPETFTVTAAGRAILDDADAAAQRATLGLGTMATQASSAVAITGGAISGLTTGGGAATSSPQGVIARLSTPASTTAVTTEEDLWSYSLPAATLTAAGSTIRVTAYGRFAANANVKTIRVYFGAHVATLNFTTTAPNGGPFSSEVIITRVNATNQLMFRSTSVGNVMQAVAASTPAETLANAITVKITGQNGTASAGDITLDRVFVEYL